MEPQPTAAAQMPPVKPKQTAKRTSNFRPWATAAASMSPASASVSPQDPSPAKITSDVLAHASPSRQDQVMPKEGGLSMTARIQEAQKQWAATQDPRQWTIAREGQGEVVGSGSAGRTEGPLVDSTNKLKSAQESPVPLPSYAQYAPEPVKRPGPGSDSSDSDIPAAKRQKGMVKAQEVGASTPTGPGTLATTPAPRTVEVNGRIMEVIDRTGERKYSEYWVTSADGSGRALTPAGGGLLPSEYQPLQSDDHPWVCPVRNCRKQMSTLKGLRGHIFPSHKGRAFNDNKDGTISDVGVYQNPEDGKTSPPVIVSCDPISPNAQPARTPWKGLTHHKQPQVVASRPSEASLTSRTQAVNRTLSPTNPSNAEEYLLQFLSGKQEHHQRLDIDILRALPRKRDLPEVWLLQHQGDNLDKMHFAAALAYLAGEEVPESGRCSRDLTRPTSRLSEKCIKLPSHMPLDAMACFSRTPTCVSCRYRNHLQRQVNDCDWHPDRRKPGDKVPRPRKNKTARSSLEEGYNSVGSSTADSDGPLDTSVAETENSEMDSDVRQANKLDDAAMEIDDDHAPELPAPNPAMHAERKIWPNSHSQKLSAGSRKESIPRMQDWEYGEGRLFDSSGKWAVAWSAPYNTGRNAFQIAPNISTHRLRLGPGESYRWHPDQDTFRDAYLQAGEIELKVNGNVVGTLTEGSSFKVQPGDSCSIQNRCVDEASLYVHVVGNFKLLQQAS